MTGIVNPFVIEQPSANLTTATTAYVSGDMLGHVTGPLDGFPLAVGGPVGSLGYITSVTLVDYAKVIGATDLFIFRDATTPASDNGANSWSDADMDKLIPGGVINIPAPTVSALNNVAVVSGLLLPYKIGAVAGTLYGNLITRSGHTFFGAATDLRLKVGGFYFT